MLHKNPALAGFFIAATKAGYEKSASRRFLHSNKTPYGSSSTSSSTTGGIRSSRVSFSQIRKIDAMYTDE